MIRSDYTSEFFEIQRNFLFTHIRRHASQPRVKIAVLDTGLHQKSSEVSGFLCKEMSTEHSSAVAEAVSFEGGVAEDTDGHGTHTTSLLMKIAPSSDLYIAKVDITVKNGIDGTGNVVAVSQSLPCFATRFIQADV